MRNLVFVRPDLPKRFIFCEYYVEFFRRSAYEGKDYRKI